MRTIKNQCIGLIILLASNLSMANSTVIKDSSCVLNVHASQSAAFRQLAEKGYKIISFESNNQIEPYSLQLTVKNESTGELYKSLDVRGAAFCAVFGLGGLACQTSPIETHYRDLYKSEVLLWKDNNGKMVIIATGEEISKKGYETATSRAVRDLPRCKVR